MKILSIGNSYSHDATRYLSQIAKKSGADIETYNLFIGGCSLRTHYINALEDRPLYSLFFNGVDTHFNVSIKQALISNEYDVVTLQQASHFSFKPETYEPYTSFLVDLVKKYNPHTNIYVHQTWGYKRDSQRLADMGFVSHGEMYKAVEKGYDFMYQTGGFSGLLPSGKAILLLHNMGYSADDVHRDNIHLSLGLGRYTAALVWLECLAGIPAADCAFSELDAEISAEQTAAAKKCAHDACVWAKKYTKL